MNSFRKGSSYIKAGTISKYGFKSNKADIFQDKFNEIVAKKGIGTNKGKVKEYSRTFYLIMQHKFQDAEYCPFPEYLEKNYYKSVNLK